MRLPNLSQERTPVAQQKWLSRKKLQRLSLDHQRQTELLTQENEALRGKILRIEERVAVLERIATDKASRLSNEIDQLR